MHKLSIQFLFFELSQFSLNYLNFQLFNVILLLGKHLEEYQSFKICTRTRVLCACKSSCQGCAHWTCTTIFQMLMAYGLVIIFFYPLNSIIRVQPNWWVEHPNFWATVLTVCPHLMNDDLHLAHKPLKLAGVMQEPFRTLIYQIPCIENTRLSKWMGPRSHHTAARRPGTNPWPGRFG